MTDRIGFLLPVEPLADGELDLQAVTVAEGKLAGGVRERVANFLQGGTPILAFMSYAYDQLGATTQISGEEGLRSDGTFYWRSDASYYVRYYGVAVSARFLEHVERTGPRARTLTRAEVFTIDAFLMEDEGDIESPDSPLP